MSINISTLSMISLANLLFFSSSVTGLMGKMKPKEKKIVNIALIILFQSQITCCFMKNQEFSLNKWQSISLMGIVAGYGAESRLFLYTSLFFTLFQSISFERVPSPLLVRN